MIDLVSVAPEGAAQLRAEVRAFLEQQDFTPRCDSWATAWGRSEPMTRALAERGWLGMTIPTEYGGGGRGPLERFVVIEELLAAGAPVSAHWVADRQTAPSLLRFGTEEQKRRFLPAIARGECQFAIGMSEPGSGSDLASVSTRASRVDGGWSIEGLKKWTGGADAADYCVVLCRTSELGEDRHAGLSQLIMDLGAEGISTRPIHLMTGVQQWSEMSLNGVFVPDEMVLGEVGTGWAQVTAELAYERSGPERILTTFPLLDAFAACAEADDDPRVLAALGSLVARLVALRWLSLGVANALAEGRAPNVEAALVKDLGTTFERDVVEAVRGARPFLRGDGAAVDALLGDAVRGTPGFTLRGGTTEILRGIVSRTLEAEPAEPVADDGTPLGAARAIAAAAQTALASSLEHTRTREQFGRPLARFQAVQQHLAVLAGHAMACRAAVGAAAEDDELSRALAKIQTSASAGEVARIAHQLHGALGFSDEHPLHRSTLELWRLRDEHGGEAEWSAWAGARLAGPGLWERLTA